jgi:flagellar protein FliS
MQQIMEYQNTEVKTSDNVKIISLLYDGAISFIKIAKQRLREGDIAAKGLYVGKATAVVGELATSLNMEAGGEISVNLRRLYDFVLDRLLYANMSNDEEAFDSAEGILEILRNAWKQIEKKSTVEVTPNINKPMLREVRV